MRPAVLCSRGFRLARLSRLKNLPYLILFASLCLLFQRRISELNQPNITLEALNTTKAHLTSPSTTPSTPPPTTTKRTLIADDFRLVDYSKTVPYTATFMARGSSPTARSKPLQINYSGVLSKDPIISRTTHELALQDYTSVKDILLMLDEAQAKAKLKDLIAAGNIFPDHIQKFLLEWQQLLPRNDPQYFFEKTLEEFSHHLKLLSERKFSMIPRINSCRNCFRQDVKFLIRPQAWLCSHSNLHMIVLVTSVVKAAEERKAVRETWGIWGREDNPASRVIFLFGKNNNLEDDDVLERENREYGDILQGDFTEHYYNLTYKVLMGYRWALTYCPNAKFIMRAADDTFVHLPNINALLSKYSTFPSFLDYQIGFCLPDLKAPRFPWFKNHLTTNEYKYERLPPYAVGTTFVTSFDLTKKMLDMSAHVPYFPIEDIYFGLLLPQVNSGCHHVEGFVPDQGLHNTAYQDRLYFTSHLETPDKMRLIFQHFVDQTHRIMDLAHG